MIDTTTSLLSELRSRSILRRDQLEEIETSLTQLLHNPQALARELVSRGWLTPYQINQLFSGRAANLTLGPYVLMERVGAGELGLIFKARHRHLNRVSAVHVVREELLAQPEAVSRFYEEVQAASHLDHANVVHLYDAGPIGRTHFLAMEHITGTDLRDLVQQNGPLPIGQACDFIRQTALGLEHGFERGLMHHALKPAFLLVTTKSEEGSGGMIKIANLGVTHLLNTTEKSQASFAGPGVSVDFLSPEQAEDPRVRDVRSELYSLGCVFYFLLTGQPPFPGGSAADRLNRHLREPAPNPARLRPDTPSAVCDIVHCLLAKRVEERYARPRDVAHNLAPYCASGSGTSGSFTVAPTASTSAETRVLRGPLLTATPVDIPNVRATPARPLLKRWKILAAAAGVCAFFGLVLLVLIGITVARWKSLPVVKSPPPPPENEASTAFRDLEARARAGKDLDRLRDDLLAFRIANPTSPEALPASELYMRLPAPLDRLAEDSIPREERSEGQPRELVGVLGEHAPKPWMSERMLTVQPAAGLVVTVAADNTIRVWDLATRVTRANLPARVNLACAAVSPDGKRLVLGGYDRFVRVFDVGASAERWSNDASKFGIQFVAFSPDGELVAVAAQDRTVRILESVGGKERASWIAHTAGMRSMAFAPDGKTLVTAGYRMDAPNAPIRRGALPEIRTWDVANGAAKNSIDLPITHHALSMLFPAAANSLATAGSDATVRFWDLQTGKEGTPIPVTTGGIAQAALVPGGKLATIGTDFAIRLWNLADGALLATLPAHTTTVFYFSVAADGRAVTASYDQTVRCWDLAAGTEIGVISGSAGWVTHALASPDGATLATGHRNGAIKIWDAATGHVRLTLPGHTLAITALAYSADGRTLASASHDLRVKLWDVDDGKEKASRDTTATIIDLAFGPERRGALGGITSDQVYVWTGLLQETARPVPHEHARGRAIAFAMDGRSVYTTGDDGNLRRWEVTTLHMKGFQQAHRTGVRALAVGPDARTLATAATNDGPIRLWTVAGNDVRERRLLPGHTVPPVALAFTSDGKTLASVAENGQIHLWDIAAGRKRDQGWLVAGGTARSVSFSPDGRHLLALNGKGVCHILRLGLPPRQQRTDAR